ncbi:MAG: putative Fe-S cluster assembly protein SufT [Verrucomicrobia bacterium]|nr:putative Fe-S cluster assembly protein SufT [Verrucomicrobiota bacterium]
MEKVISVRLVRDCDAVQIPAGNSIVLSADTEVDIIQSLGGNYTIQALGSLLRIASKDADALGMDAAAESEQAKTDNGDRASAGPVDEAAVWDVLKTCYDPEIPVNIVDLGLIYDLHLDPGDSGQSRVMVRMTLTAPGCGMGATIAGDAQQKILSLPGVEDAQVDIVWDPPWHQSMITPAGRVKLGLDD